jgi:hypothetical protein
VKLRAGGGSTGGVEEDRFDVDEPDYYLLWDSVDGVQIRLQDGFRPLTPGTDWFGTTPNYDYIERQYGLSLDEYDRMHADQDGKCAICDRHYTAVGPLVVDHDHSIPDKRHAVRALLCLRCNLALGLFLDAPHVLQWAHEYLMAYGCAFTRLLTPEKRAEMAAFTMSPEEHAKVRSESATRGWIDALRAVYASPTPALWDTFWKTFDSCTAGYAHRDRVLISAYEKWVEIGGTADEFETR